VNVKVLRNDLRIDAQVSNLRAMMVGRSVSSPATAWVVSGLRGGDLRLTLVERRDP
jgi:hypothetical protein